MSRGRVTVEGLVALLLDLCPGGSWADHSPVEPDPHYEACEACDWHPMTPELADRANRLVNAVRAAGGPPPDLVWLHCRDDLYVDFRSRDDSGYPLVTVNFFERFGWDVMVHQPPDKPYFLDLEFQ